MTPPRGGRWPHKFAFWQNSQYPEPPSSLSPLSAWGLGDDGSRFRDFAPRRGADPRPVAWPRADLRPGPRLTRSCPCPARRGSSCPRAKGRRFLLSCPAENGTYFPTIQNHAAFIYPSCPLLGQLAPRWPGVPFLPNTVRSVGQLVQLQSTPRFYSIFIKFNDTGARTGGRHGTSGGQTAPGAKRSDVLTA